MFVGLYNGEQRINDIVSTEALFVVQLYSSHGRLFVHMKPRHIEGRVSNLPSMGSDWARPVFVQHIIITGPYLNASSSEPNVLATAGSRSTGRFV
jgi:hypothetical protein